MTGVGLVSGCRIFRLAYTRRQRFELAKLVRSWNGRRVRYLLRLDRVAVRGLNGHDRCNYRNSDSSDHGSTLNVRFRHTTGMKAGTFRKSSISDNYSLMSWHDFAASQASPFCQCSQLAKCPPKQPRTKRPNKPTPSQSGPCLGKCCQWSVGLILTTCRPSDSEIPLQPIQPAILHPKRFPKCQS